MAVRSPGSHRFRFREAVRQNRLTVDIARFRNWRKWVLGANTIRRSHFSARGELLKRLVVAEPDHAQFIQLLVRHEHDLLRFVLPLVGNLEDARDVMQEAAVNLWTKFDEYDPSQPFLPCSAAFRVLRSIDVSPQASAVQFFDGGVGREPGRAAGAARVAAREAAVAMDNCLSLLTEADRQFLISATRTPKCPCMSKRPAAGRQRMCFTRRWLASAGNWRSASRGGWRWRTNCKSRMESCRTNRIANCMTC